MTGTPIRPCGPVRRREVLAGTAAVALSGAFACARLQGQASVENTGPPVWLDMDQARLDDAYNNRVYAPNMDRILEQSAFRNEAAKIRLEPPKIFSYGPGPMETLEVYHAGQEDAPVHIYIYGGTWRFGSAGEYAYLAQPFVNNGATMVVVNFSSVAEAPDGLSTLVTQVRDAVAWSYRNAGRLGVNPDRLYLSGHSSGGHLAAMALTTDWEGEYGLPTDLVKGGLCASGMYDLEPVRRSWRNSYLRLTDLQVQALSPQRHVDRLNSPVIVAYGSYETPEFQRQGRDFAAAVQAAGRPVELLVGIGYNHFEIRETLGNEFGLLGRAALQQMDMAPGH